MMGEYLGNQYSKGLQKYALASNHQQKYQSLEDRKKLYIKKYKLDIFDLKMFIMCDMNLYFQEELGSILPKDFLNVHSIISETDQDRLHFEKIFKTNNFEVKELNIKDIRESRGIGAILGMAIGDAIGASTEFLPFQKQGLKLIENGFKDIEWNIMNNKLIARHDKVGIWTDDAAMGLCIADSLLLNDYQFNPKHLRHMFNLWLQHGLNNGGRPKSIGLGANISISMQQFIKDQKDYTNPSDGFNSGNGSLMRLAPIPVAYKDNPTKAIQYSGLHSLTTHNGQQARECCKLMAEIIIELINRKEEEDGKAVIEQVCDGFKSEVKSVQFLARGENQPQELYDEARKKNRHFKKFNKTLLDRNWNWRSKQFTYSPCRTKARPGYVGSYCMDALAMALHTVYFSSSFKQVIITNANMGGDCDTVGSIAGQIAGALYGIDPLMLQLYSEMQDFKQRRYQVFLKAFKLATRQKITDLIQQ